MGYLGYLNMDLEFIFRFGDLIVLLVDHKLYDSQQREMNQDVFHRHQTEALPSPACPRTNDAWHPTLWVLSNSHCMVSRVCFPCPIIQLIL